MPVVSEVSAGNMKCSRRPRNQFGHPNHHSIPEPDPNPPIPSSIIQSTRCKSTISSLLLSTFSNNNASGEAAHRGGRHKKKNNFSAASFRGLGCTAGASQQVSVPAVIRTSADWQGKKARKKKHKRSSGNGKKTTTTCTGVLDDDGGGPTHASGSTPTNRVDFQDVWCGPGIGFSADAVAASVDCVVARRNASSRGKIDVERMNHRERLSYLGRRAMNPETISFMDSDPDIFQTRPPASDTFGSARFYRHVRHPSSEGFAEDCRSGFMDYSGLPLTEELRASREFLFKKEIMMLHGGLLMGGILDPHDQFRDWRLDVDNMSYEQLLELGERIGHVSTGLKEDEIGRHIRKIQLPFLNEALKHHINKKCSICQEEYEGDDEVGKLNCEHSYHVQCIRQWLAQKNFCPVCKQEVVKKDPLLSRKPPLWKAVDNCKRSFEAFVPSCLELKSENSARIKHKEDNLQEDKQSQSMARQE
ncbi:E3 ubiquitin-protein ligase MBR2 isoform X1 [Senna tora]|uniref:RING-type E3 ubiquitin transferase n=1 Tax=Senna tora TaxID=362788 RepID=A0A834TDS3_9FABA|nr:E3 ubiquitin-protein ligase MBR2 isoform X1 [Senna tora]